MLKARTIEIIKSTAPILKEHGETLTRHFYKRMFTHNPEVAAFFNPTNQHAGLQQKALAAAICAYAANIDNLATLGGAVELIAQKHASYRISAEQYPIVGSNLLASIREVLGEGATDEIINAWGEAYGMLADILIAREKQIYINQAAAKNGWEGFKLFRVIKKEAESKTITSFYLKPVSDKNLPCCEQGECDEGVPLFKAGQYLTVRMPHPKTGTTMRNYSISSMPGENYFRISVKKESDGFVSNALHQQIQEGDVIEIAPPCGDFLFETTKDKKRPLVFISGGIGITPVLSMLLTALQEDSKRPIYFIHGALNSRTHAFRDLVNELGSQHPRIKIHYCYSDATPEDRLKPTFHSEGFIDSALLEKLLPEQDADYYFCGPKPFMALIYQHLLKWNIPTSQIHFEFFGPNQDISSLSTAKAGKSDGCCVRLEF